MFFQTSDMKQDRIFSHLTQWITSNKAGDCWNDVKTNRSGSGDFYLFFIVEFEINVKISGG